MHLLLIKKVTKLGRHGNEDNHGGNMTDLCSNGLFLLRGPSLAAIFQLDDTGSQEW